MEETHKSKIRKTHLPQLWEFEGPKIEKQNSTKECKELLLKES
jgi:hypothetical protein